MDANNIPPQIKLQIEQISGLVLQISQGFLDLGADGDTINQWMDSFRQMKSEIVAHWEAKSKDKVVEIKNYLTKPPTWENEIEGLDIDG